MLKRIFFILFSIFLSLGALANRHEHFSSWPTASSLVKTYKDTTGNPLNSISITDLIFGINKPKKLKSRLSKTHSVMKHILSSSEYSILLHNFNINKKLSGVEKINAVSEAIDGKSIQEISQIIYPDLSKNDQDLFTKRFFKFTENSDRSKTGYIVREELRSNLFAHLKSNTDHYKKFLLASFKNTAKSIPKKNRKFIGISVSSGFYNEDLADLKKSLKKQGSTTHFYLSTPRQTLIDRTDKAFDKHIETLKRSIAQGWGNGVDITGSIQEVGSSKKMTPEKTQQVRKRIVNIVDTLTKSPNSVLRLHAFESTNKNVFHTEIYKLLDDISKGRYENPPTIAIGHLSKIDNDDILHFIELRKSAIKNGIDVNIVFDANLQSNSDLQGAEFKRLERTIAKLQLNGFEVALGSDGTGIIGKKSSTRDQAARMLADKVKWPRVKQLLKASDRAPGCRTSTQEMLQRLLPLPGSTAL